MEFPSADQVAICEFNINSLAKYPLKLQCICVRALVIYAPLKY